MAAQRPNVIVFQEYDALNVAPDIPDLNVLIVGPCYQVLDYLDDKEECYAEDYGTLNSNSPLVSPSAVILASPPNARPGALLDAANTYLFFDEARVVIVEDEPAAAANYGLYSVDDNLFYAHTAAGGIDVAVVGVAAGDIINVQGTGPDNHIKTVKEVVSTFIDIATGSNFVTNGVQPGDIVTISNDVTPAGKTRNGIYTVHRVRDEDTLEFVDTGWIQEPSGLFSGETCDFLITTASGATRLSTTGLSMANYSDIYVTTDFSEGNPATARWRAERNVDDLELASSDFSIEDNEITISAGITVDIDDTLTGKKVSFAKIYVQYTALRTDLQKMTTLSNFSEMEATLGKYDARNPLFVGSVVSKANTTTAIQVYGVKSDNLTGYLDFIDRISSEREVYAIVPLTYDTSVLAAINNMADSLADPNFALTEGIKQKFRVSIGAVDLQTSKEMISETSGAKAQAVTGTEPGDTRTLTLTPDVPGSGPDVVAEVVLPGWTVRYTQVTGIVITDYVVAQLNTYASVTGISTIEVDADIVLPPAVVSGDKVELLDLNGVVQFTHTQDAAGDDIILTSGTLNTLFLELQVAGGNFITSGTIPGDYLEIPRALTVDNFDLFDSWIVDSVVSDERIRIVNNGNNTSTVANELPHGYSRYDASPILQTGITYFRIVRQLDKTQQVNEMVAVAQSFGSKRQLLCYPNRVDVAGLVDGSLPRSVLSEPEVAAPQPGYYLACAVGGQTAGQPPQQGFTNIGIAGITEVYNSNTYFTEKQITDLSNGGVYVFVQDNPAALPYSVHEVTTDVTALEFSEYMVVKDFDFIAWTFLDTLLPFIGEWNVIPETVEFIRQAIFSTGDALKSRYVAKIGPPLVDYTVDGVEISELSRDRIEAYVDVDLPMTLNTIGLHLVA